jgi:hypothetical protein
MPGHSQAQVVSLRTLGEAQVLVQTHRPPAQPLLVPHRFPQVPQLVVVVFATQFPPQQILPSKHGTLSARLVKLQSPVVGSQVPTLHGPTHPFTDVGAPHTPF